MKNKYRIIVSILFISIILLLLVFSSEIPRIKDLIRITPVEAVWKWMDFSNKEALRGWKNKIFKGKTKYWIDGNEDELFLHSKSEKTASALYRRVSYDIKDSPILSWKWKPIKFPNKDGVTDPKLRDDYALRLYVIFASGFFTNFRCVEYLWDPSIREGTKQISPYSDKIMQLVIRADTEPIDWVTEERNVLEDYISLFGQEPNLKIRAIAIMSDSEGTQDSCEAHFKEIKIIKEL